MSNPRKRKKQFSTVVCKTDFDGRVLKVRGRLRLAAFLLLGFTILIGWVVTVADVPVPVRIMASFAGLITAYGFLDTLFGTCDLRFDTVSRDLVLTRGNPLGRVHFEGSAEDRLSVGKVSAGSASNGRIKLYTVVLTVSLEDTIVNFPLEVLSSSDEACGARIAHWQQALSVPAQAA